MYGIIIEYKNGKVEAIEVDKYTSAIAIAREKIHDARKIHIYNLKYDNTRTIYYKRKKSIEQLLSN